MTNKNFITDDLTKSVYFVKHIIGTGPVYYCKNKETLTASIDDVEQQIFMINVNQFNEETMDITGYGVTISFTTGQSVAIPYNTKQEQEDKLSEIMSKVSG